MSESSDHPPVKGTIASDLDAIAANASKALSEAKAQSEFVRILKEALPLFFVVPLFFVLTQLAYWNSGGDPSVVPAAAVIVAALGIPLILAWLGSREARRLEILRARAVGEADRRLALEGRLQAADEFLGRPVRTGFEEAAVEDAAARSGAARAASMEVSATGLGFGRREGLWAGAGLVTALASLWVGGFAIQERYLPRAEAEVAALPGEPGTAAPGGTTSVTPDTELPEERPLDPKAPRSQRAAVPERADTSPDVSESVKESAGKTGAGRSSGALSSSAASESRSSPSAQGQTSEPSDRLAPKKEAKKKKPQGAEAEEVPDEKPEDEESGATAGKGSSKGSNKNPTASDWKSRDQVTESDDQEIDDDEETEDDEEEQENRGGVQPSLRDRRPPVSRDLQIGFGNRPNPDANGRGGPSEQKKSRGVASLVLGVPIPDRIKGRPGPGPTKITQERIEPQAEDAGRARATARMPRSAPTGVLSTVNLEPGLRDLVRRYFLARRAQP